MSAALLAATGAVEAFAGSAELDRVTARRLAIIVEEIVANVLDHAAHDRDIAFTLSLDHRESGPLVTLEDDSDAFDPRTAASVEAPNPDRGGGVGLALVSAWAEIVSYDSAEGRNRLVLQQRLTG
ncbi:ATP-binding protein [Novosphingobium sp. G106]|uniref:ATP-binding protein n=1 Tax=Novosphingobium sp. G106 TaxID=2849500 RepID=UPI001C2DABA2|nr:ATP-binding protein [Novosphingobium sp. G106]MBV1689726.1 ATP-binding protein [Novosphingobium sp. G106]